ncbi:MAG: hypothetical protein IID51_06040 [Proteobacteria bacterium]|nr:hypothetical protein [Pseudomonadota bacterium]
MALSTRRSKARLDSPIKSANDEESIERATKENLQHGHRIARLRVAARCPYGTQRGVLSGSARNLSDIGRSGHPVAKASRRRLLILKHFANWHGPCK